VVIAFARHAAGAKRKQEFAMPTGANLLVNELHRHGVRVVFGMPGSHTTAIYDAIERHGGIRTILIRNEQAGAFAADGFARVTGQPGVICTTAGPGATNALTGIAEAYGDSIPVLLVTGQVNHDRLHQECGNYHEIDLEGMFRPCTKYAATVMDNQEIPGVVAQAFHAMTTGRPRPAALILPQDLMGHPADNTLGDQFNHEAALAFIATHGERGQIQTRAAAVDRAVALLAEARRPIILAGGGALRAEAAIRSLAERLRCPIITSLNGKGLIDERDPLSLGHARSVRARLVQPLADVMLAVGCRFTEVMTGFRKMQIPDKLIQVDIDAGQIGMNYPAVVGIVTDAQHALEAILDRLPVMVRSDWGDVWTQARHTIRPNREWFIDTLRAELPHDAVIFTDASEMAYRMHTDFPAYMPRSFFYPSNYIALGWGFPAAVGAAVALPGRVVVSVSGDGGFAMTCQELATAVRYGLHVIAIVHNDSAYGAIKNLQRVKHGGRYRDTDLNNPDFVKLAEAFGVPAVRVRDAAEFAAALREAIGRGGPGLIEVPDEWRSLRA
jgi:thiamine pyrophosphate-dependent acetolactate synthase large subunit-like protein